MPFQCPSCGTEQPSNSSRFCQWCGCKLHSSGAQGDASGAGCEEGPGPLIHPLHGPGDEAESISACCSTHSGVRAVGLCQACKDLVCLKCLTQKPRRHDKCGDVLTIDEALAKKDLFTDIRTQLSRSVRDFQSNLQKCVSTKQRSEDTGKTTVLGLQDLKVKTVQDLDKNYEEEASKFTAARDKQQQMIDDTIQGKVNEVEGKMKENAENYRKRIERIKTHMSRLTAVEQAMSKPLKAATLEEHIRANKEANDLTATAFIDIDLKTITGMSREEEMHLKSLAEMPLEVKPKTDPGTSEAGRRLDSITASEDSFASCSLGSPGGAPKGQMARPVLQLRDAVLKALRLGCKAALEPGNVPIRWTEVHNYKEFATGALDSVATFNQHVFEGKVDEFYTAISRRCAEALVTEIGGKITHSISYCHGGLIMQNILSSQVERFKVEVFEMNTFELWTRWAKREKTIGSDLKLLFKSPIKSLKDGSGKAVNIDMTWTDWWPTAHVKDQKKKLRVWLA